MQHDSTVGFLLDLLDRAYDRASWHGPNLRGSLRGVTAAMAVARPGSRRHSIRELTVHAAYWKYAVWRRITGAKRAGFPLAGSDWIPRAGGASAAGWRADLGLLQEMHERLRGAVGQVRPQDLHRKVWGAAAPTPQQLVVGVAFHDVYHAGQIRLVRRLLAGTRKDGGREAGRRPPAVPL